MSENKVLNIYSTADIIRVRMEVRDAARSMGLNTRDQALISLATSTLTNALGLGLGRRVGTITIECLNQEKNKGLRVVCAAKNTKISEPVDGVTKDVRWMVDALDISDPVSDQVEIALIKWAT